MAGISEQQKVKHSLSAMYAKPGAQRRTELFHAVFPI